MAVNPEVVHRLAAAVGHRDLAFFLEITDPGVEWHTSLSVVSEGGAYHGHDGVRRYVSDLNEAFDSFDVSLDDVFVVGHVAMAVGYVKYRGKASGVAQTEQFGWVMRFQEGQIVYLRSFRNPEEALAAVGTSG